MGKVKKNLVKRKATPNLRGIVNKGSQSDAFKSLNIQEILSKETDLESVRSFKSVKNKFALQKQIKKSDKIKIKKEILKQRMNVIKDVGNVVKMSTNEANYLNIIDKESTLEKFLSVKVDKKKIIPDPDEEYIKLRKKIKSVEKKEKRKKQMIKDLNTLKHLMKTAKNKT